MVWRPLRAPDRNHPTLKPCNALLEGAHMHSELSVITEQDAVPALVSYLRENSLDRLT